MKNPVKISKLSSFNNIKISKEKAKMVKGGAVEIVIIEVAAG